MALKNIIAASVATIAFAGVCRAETPRQGPKEETIISTMTVKAPKLDALDELMQLPQKEYEKNLRIGERRLSFNPNDVKGHDIVGMSYYDIWLYYSHDSQDLDKAIAEFRKGADSEVKDTYSNVALSEVFCTLGKHEDEVKELNEAIRRKPEAYALYKYRSKALKELGRNEESNDDERTALRLKAEKKS